jgi:hypothetical protein
MYCSVAIATFALLFFVLTRQCVSTIEKGNGLAIVGQSHSECCLTANWTMACVAGDKLRVNVRVPTYLIPEQKRTASLREARLTLEDGQPPDNLAQTGVRCQ